MLKYICSIITELFGIVSVKVVVTKNKSSSIDNKLNMLLLITILLILFNYFNFKVPYAS